MATRSLLSGQRVLARLLGIQRKKYEKVFGDFEVYISDDVANRSFKEGALLRNLSEEEVYNVFFVKEDENVGFIDNTDLDGIYKGLGDFKRRGGDFSGLEIFVVPVKSRVERREGLVAWQ